MEENIDKYKKNLFDQTKFLKNLFSIQEELNIDVSELILCTKKIIVFLNYKIKYINNKKRLN